MGGENPWTPEQTAKAREMLARRASEREFIEAIGRTKMSAKSRIHYVDNPSFRDRTNESAVPERLASTKKSHPDRPRNIPDVVLADRERRNLSPRTITAFVCGDPEAGRSALDRRDAGAQA